MVTDNDKERIFELIDEIRESISEIQTATRKARAYAIILEDASAAMALGNIQFSAESAIECLDRWEGAL